MAECVENFSSVENPLDTAQQLLSSIVSSNIDHTNNAGFLEISERGNLKWKGTFESLKDFVELNRISTAKWSSPGGGAKLCESENLAIRWYSSTGSITLKGERAIDVRNKLVSIAEIEKEAKQNSSQPTITQNLHTTIDLTTPSPMGRNEESIQSSDQPNNSSFGDFKATMESFVTSTTTKINLLTSEIANLKQFTPSNQFITSLQAEIVDLKAENKDLRERNRNISYIMSDLHTKIKDVENEKRSLITALKLLQTDADFIGRSENEFATANNTANYSHSAYQKVSYGKSSNSNRETAKNASKFPDISNTNKFSCLAIEDTVEVNDSNVSSQSSDDECSAFECKSNDDKRKSKRPLNSRVPRKQIKESQKHHHERSDDQEKSPKDITRSKSTKRKQLHSNRTEASTNLPSSSKPSDYHTSSQNTDRVSERHTKGNVKSKRNTVIVGDSIIKYVKGWELSNPTQRVTVKSFSGANLEDMDDFINPILRKKPDQLVLHIGTNDLRRAESQVVAHGVINLAHKIEEQCPGIDIIVSGILTRTDVKALSDRDSTSYLSAACPPPACSVLSKPMGALLQTGQFADMKFIICDGPGSTTTTESRTAVMLGTNSLVAHRVVVASRCDWFRRALTSGMKESIERTIHVYDTDKESFEEFLRFIYTGTVNADGKSMETLVELMTLSDRYEVDHLKAICEKNLVEHFKKENIFELLILADRFNAPILKSNILKYLRERKELCSSTAFTKLPSTLQKEVVQQFKKNKFIRCDADVSSSDDSDFDGGSFFPSQPLGAEFPSLRLSDSESSEDEYIPGNRVVHEHLVDRNSLENCIIALQEVLPSDIPREKLVKIALAADCDVNRALNHYFS